MKWTAKPTGDMTLSILDEDGFQVLKVDMLSQGTMQAGLEGRRLMMTMNDLTIIAGFSEGKDIIGLEELPYEDEGYSPKPWSVTYDERRRTIKVSSIRKICDRKYPTTTPIEKIQEIYSIIRDGIERFNAG